ncbi:MAG: GNAT family N-acetyltransferase [Candidatus Eisenbacteria bacterium]|nr:GNAT family N-acetyltransferase [Candidatus Eisenbacteria bacterium]
MPGERSIDVHPLRPGEETLWLSVASAPGEIAVRRPSFTDLVGGEEHRDRRCHLIAVDEGRAAGRLTGTFLNPRLYFIQEILSNEPDVFGDVAEAFGSHLARSFGPERVEILSWERDDLAEMNQALLRSGFRVGRRKVFVERDLSGVEAPDAGPFTYISLAQTGEPRFVEIMSRAAEGDPFEDVAARDPMTDFRELVEYAGEMFDPTWWKVARRNGRTVGVVLPQRFPGPRNEGTLFYMGIVPERRNEGLGRALHRAGLAFLAQAGVERYIGSTDDRNVPMLRIFDANDCVRKGIQLFLTAGGGNV